MPSVTEVLDYLIEPELLNWFRNNSKAKCKAISDEAKRVGSSVDLLVQQDIKEGGYLVPEDDSPIQNCMNAWELFKKDYPEFVASVKEMQVELRDGEIVGHPDFIRERDQWWNVTDLKCASGIRPRYWTQISKYADLKMKMAGWGIPCSISVLRLDKQTGLYEYKEITDPEYIEYEIKVFEAYLTAFHHNVRNREQIRLMLEKELFDVI